MIIRLGWKYYVSLHISSPGILSEIVRQLVYVFWLAFETVFLWFFVIETKNVRLCLQISIQSGLIYLSFSALWKKLLRKWLMSGSQHLR